MAEGPGTPSGKAREQFAHCFSKDHTKKASDPSIRSFLEPPARARVGHRQAATACRTLYIPCLHGAWAGNVNDILLEKDGRVSGGDCRRRSGWLSAQGLIDIVR